MNNAFPIDYEALQKGDFVRQEQIEKIYQLKWRDDPNAYRLVQLRLADDIRAHRRDLAAHIKTTCNDIEILHDLQADDHTHKQIQQAQGRIVTFNVRRATIDRSGFSPEERAKSDSRDRMGQAVMVSVRSAIEKANRDELLASLSQVEQLK